MVADWLQEEKTNLQTHKLYSGSPPPSRTKSKLSQRSGHTQQLTALRSLKGIFLKAFVTIAHKVTAAIWLNVNAPLKPAAVSVTRWPYSVRSPRLAVEVPLLRRTLCALRVDSAVCFHSVDPPSVLGKKKAGKKKRAEDTSHRSELHAWNWRIDFVLPAACGPGGCGFLSHLGAVSTTVYSLGVHK